MKRETGSEWESDGWGQEMNPDAGRTVGRHLTIYGRGWTICLQIIKGLIFRFERSIGRDLNQVTRKAALHQHFSQI